jgi:7-cyano-7-deazaguanine reductase
MSNADHLVSLGEGSTKYPTEYDESVLEKIPFEHSGTSVVEVECPEFTSLCPKTGQPDFAKVTIRYKPDQFLIESKALKLYLYSFRNHGEFHEDCIAKVLYDLTQPFWIEVRGDFTPRGGISINPTAIVERQVTQKGTGVLVPR